MKNNFFFIIVLFFSTIANAGLWKIEKKTVEVPSQIKGIKNYASQIHFHSRDGRSFLYFPEKFPYDYNRFEEYVLGGKTYFTTIWFVGAQSMFFRVFNPEASQKPICEFHSDVNKTKLKLGRQGLEILVSKIKLDHVYEDKWVQCAPRS